MPKAAAIVEQGDVLADLVRRRYAGGLRVRAGSAPIEVVRP